MHSLTEPNLLVHSLAEPSLLVHLYICTVMHACMFNSFVASLDFGHLLLIFANCLEPDQDQQNVGTDLGLNCCVSERFFLIQ